MRLTLSRSTLDKIASAFGLQVVAITPLPVSMHEDANRLRDWQAKGFAGEMKYMQRDAALFEAPHQLAPSAQSIVSFATFYDRGPHPKQCPLGSGRVARYAWGRDYHRALKKQLVRVVSACEEALGAAIQARIFSDSVPLLERALARKQNAAFVGKNTMLIQDAGRGSFFFLSEILWDVTVEDSSLQIAPPGCQSCTRCAAACPTGALDTPYQLNAPRCISYLTIEKRGALNLSERRAIGEWIFGCDICQEVCPFNHQARKDGQPSTLPVLSRDAGCGPLLDLKELLTFRTPEMFTKRFAGTALMRAGRVGLLRNAAIVAANTGAVSLLPALHDAFRTDGDEVVRSHAFWAIVSLAKWSGEVRRDSIEATISHALRDPSALVSKEVTAWNMHA